MCENITLEIFILCMLNEYYTIMDFLSCVHDVICSRKNNIDRGCRRGQYLFFLLHTASYTPDVLLYELVHEISTYVAF